MKRIILLAVMALVLATFPIMGVGASGDHPALTPEEVDLGVLAAGVAAEFNVEKTVHTPEFPPMLDVYFLADTTGSMGPVLTNVKNNAAAILAAVGGGSADVRFGAGDYKDFPFDTYAFDNGASIPAVDDAGAAALAEIATWSASGGVDGSEGQFFALDRLANDIDPLGGTIGWRAGSTPVVVWFGDAPAHDPVCAAISGLGFDITEASVTSALISAGVRVIAVNTPTGFYPFALDDNPTTSANDYSPTCAVINGLSGQASRIGPATGGAVLTAATPDQVSDAILEGLGNLPVDVSMATDCAAPINVTFDPATQTVTSGDDAFFTETISVDPDAEPGVYHCDDWALINGEPMTDASGGIIYEHKTITVAAPFCEEGVNPDGKTPQAPGTGQNEDGFYLIGAYPQGAQLDVFLLDDGTGHVFGPFLTTTSIKYTEANGATPSIKAGPGAVDWRIKGQGDAYVLFTDDFGNVAEAACFVPPPPK